MFGTCSNYITLRLLGEELDANVALTQGRGWILSHGGATLVPQWGKIWLSVCLTCIYIITSQPQASCTKSVK
jgi:cycloartenol synthase